MVPYEDLYCLRPRRRAVAWAGLCAVRYPGRSGGSRTVTHRCRRTRLPDKYLLTASTVTADGFDRNGLDLSAPVLARARSDVPVQRGPFRSRPAPTVTTGGPGPPRKGHLAPHQDACVSRRSYRKPGRLPDLPRWRLRWQRPWAAQLRPTAPQSMRPIRRSGRSLLTSARCLRAPLAQLAEQRTLNPRVRGSSPWRRTRSDLGFYRPRSFFMCPVCPGFPAVLAPCSLGGRMLGGWAACQNRMRLV